MIVNENKLENTPIGGALVGKRKGQTMIHNKGSMSGYLVGKTHAEGGIKAINKSTGQPLEMQGGEVVITAPAVSDQTKRNFDGKMMTNRQILSAINQRGGGVSFADGGELPSEMHFSGTSYNYGGKMLSDHDIAYELSQCGCEHEMKGGGHLAEGFSLRDIAEIHQVPLAELKKQVGLGMKAESEHTASKREQMKIVKDHLFENPNYYTLLKKAGLEDGGNIESLYENENDYVKYIIAFNLADGVELYKLNEYLKSKGLSNFGLLPDNIKKDPKYIKIKRDFDIAFKRLQNLPKFKYPKNRDRVQEQKDRKKANKISDKIIQIKLQNESFKKGGEVENLSKDAKSGNTPARDLNNYNDVLDVGADGEVGGDVGLYVDGGFIAPNGNKSNLTPEQYKLVRTPEFKAWFGDWENEPKNASKVVDENGEPLIVYHGTPPNFYKFNIFQLYNEGIFFTDQKWVAKRYSSNYDNSEFGELKNVFLKIKNPKFIKTVKYEYDGYQGADANLKKQVEKYKKTHPEYINQPYKYKELVRQEAEKNGFDGFELQDHSWGKNIEDGKQYAVFNPNQIKLADGTNTTFDGNNDDIRYNDGGRINKAKYRILNSDGRIKYTGTEMGSWFTLEKAKQIVDYSQGEMIYEYDNNGERLYEVLVDGGGINYSWDTTFTNGFNKGQKLSEQQIETIDVYNDFVYGLLFKSGGSFDAKTEETIGLLSITDNQVNLAVILEKDPSGFNSEAIRYNQKIKRRLHNLAEKSNRKIVLNNNASSRVNREFPYLLVSENDAKNYDLATEFYEKLETPRKESRKKLIEQLEKEKEVTENMSNNNEYEYVLTQRPFGIGTYPTKDFVRFEDRDFNYGVLVYSQPISLNDIEHYSLSPITELKEYDGKILDYKIGSLNLKAKVKLILDNRKGYFVNLFISDDNGIVKTQPMSGIKFLEEIKNGRLTLENQIKDEPKKDDVEITTGYFKVDSENTGFEYAKKINNYFNKWNKIKTLQDKLDFEMLDVPMFGSFENETVLNQIESFEKIGFELFANEIVRNDFKKEVGKIIGKKIFDREMDKRRYPKEDEEVAKKQKSFESEGSTEGKGKLYEFFTPQVVADKMLALAQHYGFKGGNVLEPATGSGRLIKNLKDTNITAFEISKDNFEILKREFPNAELYNFNFEKAFLKEPRFNTLLNRKGTETWLKGAPFDLVLANPPYGKFSGLYSSYFNFKGQVEHFFILQTLYLLKKGGLGVYLIPSSFLRNGANYNEIKKQIFEIAEFVDAYRLPSNIFEKTQIGTDILILRKK